MDDTSPFSPDATPAPSEDAPSIRRRLGETLAGLPGRVRKWLVVAAGRQPLYFAALATVSGVWLADVWFGVVSFWVWVGLAGGFVVPGVVSMRRGFGRKELRPVFWCAVTLFGFGAWHAHHLQRIEAFPLRPVVADGLSRGISGRAVISSEPRLSEDGERISAVAQIVELDHLPTEVQHPGSVRVRVSHRLAPELEYGSVIEFSGRLRPLQVARNPGMFSADRFYYRSADAVGQLDIGLADRLEIRPENEGWAIIRIAGRCREALSRSLERGLEAYPERAAILKSMALGAREETPEEAEEAFRLSGTLHIFAVSGLHVGICLGFLWGVLWVMRVPRRAMILLVIPALLAYATITGLRPSAVRATIMAVAILLAFLFRRRPCVLNSIGLAALAILAVNTQQIFLPGFQLSFAVVSAIVIGAPWLTRRLEPLYAPDPFMPPDLIPKPERMRLRATKAGLLWVAVSLSAWVGSLPFIAWHFHLITPVAVMANLILIPLSTLILWVAFASLGLSIAGLGPAAGFANQVAGWIAWGATACGAWFASWPGAHFHAAWPVRFGDPECEVVVLDTSDSGGATLITGRDEKGEPIRYLVDTGHEFGFSYAVEPFLRHAGVNHLDGLIVSHGDSSHMGAAAEAVRRWHPDTVLETHLPNRSPAHRPMREAAADVGVPIRQIDGGEAGRLTWGPDSKLEVVFPPTGYPAQPAADDQCMVLRLTHRGFRVLLMADSGFVTEKWMLENLPPEELKADVLVKGWHRADYSGLAEFLNAVSPAAVIATNAAFPAGEAISTEWRDMVGRKGIALFDQAETGAVTLTFPQNEEGALALEGYVNGQSLTIRRR